MSKVSQWINALLVWSFSVIVSVAYAQEDLDSFFSAEALGEGDGASALKPIVGFLGTVAQFLTGPWAVFIVLAALVLAIGSWIWAPDNKAIGWLLRAVAGGILLLTIGTWVVQLANVDGG